MSGWAQRDAEDREGFQEWLEKEQRKDKATIKQLEDRIDWVEDMVVSLDNQISELQYGKERQNNGNDA